MKIWIGFVSSNSAHARVKFQNKTAKRSSRTRRITARPTSPTTSAMTELDMQNKESDASSDEEESSQMDSDEEVSEGLRL